MNGEQKTSNSKDFISYGIIVFWAIINITDAIFAKNDDKLGKVHFYFDPFLDTVVAAFWVAVFYHFSWEIIMGIKVFGKKYGFKFYEKTDKEDANNENSTS